MKNLIPNFESQTLFMLKLSTRIILLSIVFIGFTSSGNDFIYSQSDYSEEEKYNQQYSINWHRSIPESGMHDNRTAAQKIGDFILGKNPVILQKPVDFIWGTDNNSWILNQENKEIIEVSGSKLSRVKLKKGSINRIMMSLVAGCYVPGRGLIFTESSNDMVYVLGPDNLLVEFCEKDLLERPTGITYSEKTETIWVVETGAHRISIFDKKGNLIRRIGERGTDPMQFNFPTHICSDKNGFAYIVDAMNFRVQILSEHGVYITSFGKAGNATGKFARPKGIAVDSHGNIYVVDGLFNNIQIFNTEGELLSYFGSKGSANGEFLMPSGIKIDHNDYIYVSDSFNDRIQVFRLLKE